MRIAPSPCFRGRFTLPGDKSVSHRAAMLAAIAHGESRLANFSTGEDCASTLRCLQSLGVAVRREGTDVAVLGKGPEGLQAPASPLDVGNSGSTLRMLAGILAGRPFRSVLTGDASIRRRPVERVAAPLRAMGARADGALGRPPLAIEGGPLRGITWDLPMASAQVKTAVLLAGLQAEGRTTVREPAPSRDHTERLLPAFGVPVRRGSGEVSVEGGVPLRPLAWRVPGDVSSAAFLIVAALIARDGAVRIDGVLLNPGRVAFLDVLRRMGAAIDTGVEEDGIEPVGWVEARASALRGIEVGPALVPSLIDEIPALAVAGAFAEGAFAVSGAAELRVKESDRISALAEGLGRMGAAVEERPDGFVVEGGAPLHAARVRSHGDHRIAMALAVAALAAQGETEIEDGQCAAVSFPEFPALLERGRAGGP